MLETSIVDTTTSADGRLQETPNCFNKTVLRKAVQHCLVNMHKQFGGMCCLHLQGSSGNCLPNYILSTVTPVKSSNDGTKWLVVSQMLTYFKRINETLRAATLLLLSFRCTI